MPRSKISEYSATANSNTDVAGINVDEGCAPSGINNAIRAVMGHLKDFQTGTSSDPLTVGGVLTVTGGSASAPAITTAGDTNTGVAFPAADTVAIATGGTERARIDSSGNLGLGVTPSAWASAWKALQLANGSSFVNNGATNYTGIYQNAYYNGTNNLYLSSTYALKYELTNGTHAWFNSAAGTAGNAISFTQAMTLDASGNLGVGTTSPTTRLNVAGPVTVNGAALATNQTSAAVIDYQSTVQAARFFAYGGASVGQFNWYQGSGGNNPTQTMTLDSSGNLLVGTTSAVRKLTLESAAVQISLRHSSSTAGKRWDIGPDSAGNAFVVYNQNSNGVYLGDGATSWSANSDERLKTPLTPFENAVAKIATLRAGTGRYLTDDESVSRSFLIAQDVQAVLPEAVNVKDDEIGTLGLQYADLIPLLTAAIQEQQALITSLTARIEALEA